MLISLKKKQQVISDYNMNVVRKRKEDLNSDKKIRRRKVSVNEPLDIVIISEEAKTSNVIKDLNNNKENVQI